MIAKVAWKVHGTLVTGPRTASACLLVRVAGIRRSPTMKFLIPLALAMLLLPAVAAPAEARLGDTPTVAREMARRKGAVSVTVHTSHPYPADPAARVIAETWTAPAGGWTLEEAASYLKLIVGNRRRLMVKTSKIEQGWAYSFRYQDHVNARCLFEKDRVREISAQTGAYLEADATENRTATFALPPN